MTAAAEIAESRAPSAAGSPLGPLEVAAGLVLDPRRRRAPLPAVPRGDTPRAALERAVLPALLRAPCVVSFSGGRDSSAVLAVAAHVARREGLPPPVPVTNRFAGRADESGWQETVVARLGLPDWVRLEHGDELDCVGPVARRVLLRHGLLWPFNAHFHVPILAQARGGTVLTGIGGDEALTPPALARRALLLRRGARPEPRDLLRLGFAAAPRPLRAVAAARRVMSPCRWLRPAAHRELVRAVAAELATAPARWAEHYAWLAGARATAVGLASLARLADDAEAAIAHPLCDPAVLAALGALPPPRRFTSRAEAMEQIAGDLLDRDLLRRRDKTSFDEVFWTRHSRAFAASRDGVARGHDAAGTLVDPARLRAEWSGRAPDARSFTLLQAAWLARQAPISSSSRAPARSREPHSRGRRSRHAGSAA